MTTLERVDLPVEGMTCASCVGRVRTGISDLDGVESALVNLATKQASVVFDPGAVAVSEITGTIEGLGYSVPSEPADPTDPSAVPAPLRRKVAYAIVASSIVMAVTMVEPLRFDGWRWAAGALTTVVVWWSGGQFHRAAVVNLRHRTATMDTLVSLGTLTAWTWSTIALIAGSDRHVWFETAAMIVTLILLGRALEARAKARAGDALRALGRLAAPTVILEDGREIDADELTTGHRFLVRPGDRVATDGRVIEGASAVDMSMLTGESMPVPVAIDDEVIGATVNGTGSLVVEATRTGGETVLAQIVRLVEQAQGSMAPIQRLVDRVAAVFVPIVVAIAAVTFAVWIATGEPVRDGAAAAVAVLVVACPCAMGLATPTAIMVGTGRGAQLGIIIRGGEVLEDTRRIDTIVFDKTGTVTLGRPEVLSIHTTDHAADDVLARAAAVESQSAHPIAGAVTAAAADRLGSVPRAELVRETPGVGTIGTVDGVEVRVGRRSHVGTLDPGLVGPVDAARDSGRTVAFVGWGGRVTGVLVVADPVKDTSPEAVDRLRDLGLRIVLLSGDNERTATAVGERIGADEVIADVTPDAKDAEIQRLQSDGLVVAMVGDGVNDAPALARADLGISMGSGTAVAIEASDLTIVAGDLRLVSTAIRLSRRTLSTIKGNLFWAFAYNVAAIPLAAAGVLTPMMAAAAMGLSSVFVVSNSLRLRRFDSR